VVVLGPRGFVGSKLLDFLKARGWACRAVPRQEIDLCEPGAPERLRALLEPEDAVVVAAALTPDKGRDVATLMKNLRMAECLGQVLAGKPCAHLVYISSDAVYDGREPLISEETAASPSDLYALMHIARERMLGHAAQAKGIPVCVLRPVAIFGAGDTHNSYGPNRFMRTALKERRIQLFGGGEEIRDHVYVADVVAVIGSMLERRSTGVLNLASGRAVSFHDLAELIDRLIGSGVTIESLPRSGKVTHRHFDTTALARSLPQLRQTPLEDALRQSLEELQASSGR
jgi:nucleoside-diphosphate-sugar epimerase